MDGENRVSRVPPPQISGAVYAQSLYYFLFLFVYTLSTLNPEG